MKKYEYHKCEHPNLHRKITKLWDKTIAPTFDRGKRGGGGVNLHTYVVISPDCTSHLNKNIQNAFTFSKISPVHLLKSISLKSRTRGKVYCVNGFHIQLQLIPNIIQFSPLSLLSYLWM